MNASALYPPATPASFAPSTNDHFSVHGEKWWWSASTWAALLAGFLTAFTVSLVGEMPLGELVLIAVAGWAALCLAVRRTWPGPLLQRRFLWTLLAAQLLALGAYMASDIYRHSSPHDMARGWGRMVFLSIDVVAVAYLFGCARRNLVFLVLGLNLGDVVNALIAGPMFGDMWKFGVGAPLTFVVFVLAPAAGPLVAALAAGAIGVVHFALDYRSYGALCLLAGAVSLLQITSPRFRLWLAPLAAAVALGAVAFVYGQLQSGGRATRSDIERTAMVTAALEAFQASPLIGHGSWFSNTDVYDNFMQIRHDAAKRNRVGGFAHPHRRPDTMALHSQILVALAEGGLVGGAFFFVFGAGLIRTLARMLLSQPWHRFAPLHTLLLLSALWSLLFSPFSGAHRVTIAMACGLIALLQTAADPGRTTDELP